jgi:ectoine hydroxylase-related dioxygenase (phytanoyl-CoA dioxygenase family)
MNDNPADDGVSRRSFLKAAGTAPALAAVLGSDANAEQSQRTGSAGAANGNKVLSDDLKAEFDEYGFIVLEEVIPRQHALRVEERVKEIMARQPDADKVDQHLPGLFNHLDPKDDALFVPLVAQPVCLAIAETVLGEGFQMTEVGCRWRKPGAAAGPLRVTRPTDRFSRAGLPMPNICFVLGISWMLSDLTRDMGVTLYLPFSHHVPRGPRAGATYNYLVPVEAPAGSVLVHHSGVWHGFGANTTKDKARVGVMSGYIPGWMDLVSVGWQPLKRSIRDRLPEPVRRMNTHVIDG